MFENQDSIQNGLIRVARRHGLGLHDLVTLSLILEMMLLPEGEDILEAIQAIREEMDEPATLIPKYSFLKSIRRWSVLHPAVVEACEGIRGGRWVARKNRQYVDDVAGALIAIASGTISADQYATGLFQANHWYLSVGRNLIGRC